MILLLGGSGLLGTELSKSLNDLGYDVYKPSSKEVDVLNLKKIPNIDLVINSVGFTDVEGAEVDVEKKISCFELNVTGARNVVKQYFDVPLVHISTEYVLNPINFYSATKVWGEQIVLEHPNHLIIRTLFKPKPFPYERAFTDQYTTGDYVDIIAALIAGAIKSWDYQSRTIHLGTGRKTIFELAKRTNPDIQPIFVDDVKTVQLPKDYL